jgi:hypothetical protein
MYLFRTNPLKYNFPKQLSAIDLYNEHGLCFLWGREWTFMYWLVYLFIYLQLVRTLTVPMHLGLIDRPFVPHNLISTQDSPVLLPKIQMAPRLKILMSSSSNKWTHIYSPFLSKVPASEPPPGSPTGPLWRERYPLTGLFYISLDMFISKTLRKERPSVFPRSRASVETYAHSRALLNISFRVPSKGALPPGPPHGVLSERDVPFLEPSIHHYKSPTFIYNSVEYLPLERPV